MGFSFTSSTHYTHQSSLCTLEDFTYIHSMNSFSFMEIHLLRNSTGDKLAAKETNLRALCVHWNGFQRTYVRQQGYPALHFSPWSKGASVANCIQYGAILSHLLL